MHPPKVMGCALSNTKRKTKLSALQVEDEEDQRKIIQLPSHREFSLEMGNHFEVTRLPLWCKIHSGDRQ